MLIPYSPPVTEANDVQLAASDQLKFPQGFDQSGKVTGLFNILFEQFSVFSQAVLFEAHPDFQRAETPRQFRTVIGEPSFSRAEPAWHARKITRGLAECFAMLGLVAHQYAAYVVR